MGKNTFWSIITVIGIEIIAWCFILPVIIAENNIAATVALSIISCVGIWILYEIYTSLDK